MSRAIRKRAPEPRHTVETQRYSYNPKTEIKGVVGGQSAIVIGWRLPQLFRHILRSGIHIPQKDLRRPVATLGL